MLIRAKLKWQQKRCPVTILKEYLHATEEILNKKLIASPLMAFDLEMTGLDPKIDRIVSIGIAPIENMQIKLAKACHILIAIDCSVDQSAAVHGVLDKDLVHAMDKKEALLWFLEQTKGYVLVAHHAPLDLSFLQKLIEDEFNFKIKLPAIDTLALEKKRLVAKQQHLYNGTLRLGASRLRYNLPIYAAHNALIDAIACAELFLAQVNDIYKGSLAKIKVKNLF